MENSAGLVLRDLRTAGSHLGNAEDIQCTLGRWDVLRAWVVVLRSDRQAAELGSHSQRLCHLGWLSCRGVGAADRAWARVGLGSRAWSGTGLLAEEECISG